MDGSTQTKVVSIIIFKLQVVSIIIFKLRPNQGKHINFETDQNSQGLRGSNAQEGVHPGDTKSVIT